MENGATVRYLELEHRIYSHISVMFRKTNLHCMRLSLFNISNFKYLHRYYPPHVENLPFYCVYIPETLLMG